MLKIRLARIGRKKQPFFRIVVKEARSKREGMYTDIIGWYDPTKQPHKIQIDMEKYQYWIKNGAQPTEAVERMVLSKEDKEKKWPAKKKAEKKSEE